MRLSNPHWPPGWVEVSVEDRDMGNGISLELAVATTPLGTVTRWTGVAGRTRAALDAMCAALDGEVDVVDVEDVLLKHDEDHRITTVRATTPNGTKTRWLTDATVEERGAQVLRDVCNGEFDAQ